ncbi:hypothetical protein AMTR_s00067p00022850 [Amborella trichopoda]|uniref:Pre-mRNA-splicing factor SLU7 n=1 Tax=Amborella trichopoda TaxID=13333 RepID=U5DEB2_AMBTC|nr:hypothetical protein AMTR_s00067p00022850 [Amborella trichopoda]
MFPSVPFKSIEDHRKRLELEVAQKAGIAPAEVDEDGHEINPHIPQYMSPVPWYLNAAIQFEAPKKIGNWTQTMPRHGMIEVQNYSMLEIIEKALVKYNSIMADSTELSTSALLQKLDMNMLSQDCGAMTHENKSCTERPRNVGARWTNKHVAPDEKVEALKLNYEAKRGCWNGFKPSTYAHVIERYEARRKYQKEQPLKKLQEKNHNQHMNGKVSDEQDSEDALRVDEAKVDENKQIDFAKVDKCVRTTGVGSTGTVRISGQALEFKQLSMQSLEAFGKGQDIHMQEVPAQAELLHREFMIKKEKLESQMKETILDNYGDASCQEELPRELLLGQCETNVAYDHAGRIIKGQEKSIPNRTYEEDVYINNLTSQVYGVHGGMTINGAISVASKL